jgi:hypothetical protein
VRTTTTFITLTIFLLTLVFACEKSRLGFEEPGSKEKEEERVQGKEEYTDTQKTESALDFNAKDIGKIEKFTPEIFVKVTIIYKKESREWIQQSGSLSPENQNEYIEKANRLFFAQFGTTEEEYLGYSQNNIDELDRFLKNHPEFLSLMKEY